jgi:hypothetical protein
MDFGVSFEADFRLFRRFTLVEWAKKQTKIGLNAARKAPPFLCNAASLGRPEERFARRPPGFEAERHPSRVAISI